MAHASQKDFITACLSRHTQIADSSKRILEVGSQNINGAIRDYFPEAIEKQWVGLDIGSGPGVDFTIPGELIQLSNGWADISFSTECFEHAKQWKEIFLNMIRVTRADGLVILTFAGDGRSAHGTIDSDLESSPFTSDYYKNISLAAFASKFDLNMYFSRYAVEVSLDRGDTYFWGIRNAILDKTEWMNEEECLARARGQLDKIIEVNKLLNHSLAECRKELLAANSNKLLALANRALWKAYRFFRHL